MIRAPSSRQLPQRPARFSPICIQPDLHSARPAPVSAGYPSFASYSQSLAALAVDRIICEEMLSVPIREWFETAMQPRRTLTVEEGSSVVRARLQRMIEKGSLPADGRLPTERELSESMGIGRRAVRSALDSLLADGLIWRKQGKGTFAGQAPDKTQVLAAEIVGETSYAEVMEARLCIEPTLAAMSARHAVPSDIARMRNLARRTVEATDPGSIEIWDGALHRLIARTALNKPLFTAFSMIDEIRSNAGWRGLRAKARSLETLKVSDGEHHAIIDQIEAGSPEGAEAAMRRHLTTLASNLKRILSP